jgi:polyhydroxyalkanoate synthesis regulator phasin
MKVIMNDLSLKWKQIFDEISTANGHVEVGEINYYKLASILEDLYVENAELKERIEALETQLKDVQEVVLAHEYIRNIGL